MSEVRGSRFEMRDPMLIRCPKSEVKNQWPKVKNQIADLCKSEV